MVGGFVEQQHVRLRQEKPAQRDATTLTTGNLRDVCIPWRQAQRIGSYFELTFQFPAAFRVDGVLQLRLLFEQLVHFIGIEIRIGELVADRVEAIDQRLHVADAFNDIAAHVLARVEWRFLRQQADLGARLRSRFAVVLFVHSRHDPQQRGFARSVETQHADLGAGKERQGDVAQDDPLRRHHLGHAIHGVDELGHRYVSDRKGRVRMITEAGARRAGLPIRRPALHPLRRAESQFPYSPGRRRTDRPVRFPERPSVRLRPSRSVHERAACARPRGASAEGDASRGDARGTRILSHCSLTSTWCASARSAGWVFWMQGIRRHGKAFLKSPAMWSAPR